MPQEKVHGYERHSASGKLVEVKAHNRNTTNAGAGAAARKIPGRPPLAAQGGQFANGRSLPNVWVKPAPVPPAAPAGAGVPADGTTPQLPPPRVHVGPEPQATADLKRQLGIPEEEPPATAALKQRLGIPLDADMLTLAGAVIRDTLSLSKGVVEVGSYERRTKTGARERVRRYERRQKLSPDMGAKKGTFTLYRGEGSHDKPSFYPTTGPGALAGAWWTSNLQSAKQYAKSSKGKVYKIDVTEDEAEPHGLPGYYMIKDPKVRARRQPYEELPPIDSVNPTGSVFADYTPEQRAKAPLAPNMKTLAETQGKDPNEPIKIYRGAPPNQTKIVPGDFITTNRQLAQDYAGTGKVLELDSRYGDILDDATEPGGEEYLYRPGADAEPQKTAGLTFTDGVPDNLRQSVIAAIGRIKQSAGIDVGNLTIRQSGNDPTALAYAANDRFYVTPPLSDDTFMKKYGEEWGGGMSLAGGADKSAEEVRQAVIIHEIGHVLEHRVNTTTAGRQRMNDLVTQPTTARDVGFSVGEIDKLRPRWEVDTLRDPQTGDPRSAYAQESRYEWIAEAFTDGVLNGDNASPSSKQALEILRDELPPASDRGTEGSAGRDQAGQGSGTTQAKGEPDPAKIAKFVAALQKDRSGKTVEVLQYMQTLTGVSNKTKAEVGEALKQAGDLQRERVPLRPTQTIRGTHVTSVSAAGVIGTGGFKQADQSVVRGGNELGRGVYIGIPDTDGQPRSQALYEKQYRMHKTPSQTLSVEAQVQNPAVIDYDKISRKLATELRQVGPTKQKALFSQIPGFAEKYDELLAPRQKASHDFLTGPDFGTKEGPGHPEVDPSEVLQALGYDSVILRTKSRSAKVGGSQLVVFDPAKVRVVSPGDTLNLSSGVVEVGTYERRTKTGAKQRVHAYERRQKLSPDMGAVKGVFRSTDSAKTSPRTDAEKVGSPKNFDKLEGENFFSEKFTAEFFQGQWNLQWDKKRENSMTMTEMAEGIGMGMLRLNSGPISDDDLDRAVLGPTGKQSEKWHADPGKLPSGWSKVEPSEAYPNDRPMARALYAQGPDTLHLYKAPDGGIVLMEPSGPTADSRKVAAFLASVDRALKAGDADPVIARSLVTFHVSSNWDMGDDVRAYVRPSVPDDVFVNPDMLNDDQSESGIKERKLQNNIRHWFSPAFHADSTDPTAYQLTHELGHIRDARNKDIGGVEEARRFNMQAMPSPLSRYAKKDVYETYAEQFAQWALSRLPGYDGRTPSSTARFARRFNWGQGA